jgi:hypothetical protein
LSAQREHIFAGREPGASVAGAGGLRAAHVRKWILWWFGVALVPLSGLIMTFGTRRCSGFWPTDVVTHHRCVGAVPAIVWLMWLLAFACMTAAMIGLERAKFRTVVLAQAVAGILFVFTPTMPTADAYQYHIYGAMLGHSSPWRPAPLVTDRPAVATGLRIWGNPPLPAPYGPLFVLYEHELGESFPRLSADQLIYIERVVGLLAALAITVLLRGPRVAWWALHPLILFEFAVAAHCDVFMLGFLAASVRLRNPIAAGIAIGCSAMVKLVGLGASAFRIGTLPYALATAAAIIAFFPTAATLAPAAAAASGFSGSPALFVIVLVHALHVPQPEAVTRAVVLALGIVVAISLRSGRRDAPLYGTLLFILCSTWIIPWYLTWLVFASRFAHRRTAVAAALIASASLVLEAKNQFANRIELVQAFLFLSAVAGSLGWAWSRGDGPRPAAWLTPASQRQTS